MNIYSKQDARRILQGRLVALPDDDATESAKIVQANASTLLAAAYKKSAVASVLSYHAVSKWCEVDVSLLEEEFPEIQFDYVGFDPQAALPTAIYSVILVPLYGFTDEGYRLGHGNGWYDRLLAKQPAAYRLGIGLEANRVAFEPEKHDIRLDCIVTEKEIYRFTRS